MQRRIWDVGNGRWRRRGWDVGFRSSEWRGRDDSPGMGSDMYVQNHIVIKSGLDPIRF